MENKLRVAYLGFWHSHALPNPEVQFPGLGIYGGISQCKEVEPVIGWDWDEARGKKGCDILGLPFTTDLEAVLSREDIDAVVVACETSKHLEVCVQAAQHKKHIYVNKLLAPTGREAEKIVAAVKENGVVMIVMLSRLYEQWCRKIRDVVQSGEIGKLIDVKIWHAHGIVTKYYPSDGMGYLPDGHGFLYTEYGGGGCYADMCHPQYMLPFLVGKMPVRAYAHMSSVMKRGDIEDNAVVMYEFEDGPYAILEEGWANGPVTTDVVIHGTDGTILYRDDRSDKEFDYLAVRSGDDPKFRRIPFGPAEDSSLSEFIRRVKTGENSEENLQRSIDLSYMSEAAYRSAKTHMPVDFADLKK